MLTYNLILFLAVLLVSAITFIIFKFSNKNFSIYLKILGILVAIFLVFRYFWDDLYFETMINPGVVDGFTSRGDFVFAVILHWVEVAAILMVILYPFFSNVKTLKILSALACPVILLLSIIFFDKLSFAYFGPAIIEEFSVRAMFLSLEVGFGFVISIYTLIDLIFKWKEIEFDAKTIINLVLSFVGMLLCTFPNYIPQLLLNPYDFYFKVEDLNLWHRLYIYPSAVIPIVLFLFLKDKPLETKRFAVIYYALAGLYLFSLTHQFENFTTVTGLPFHLCNTALYITPLCLIFNGKKVFYFTYFINVLGAFLAIAMPDINLDGINGTVMMSDVLLFFRSHYQAFFMPLLTVGLGIFERPRLKEFKYSLVGFAAYYVLVLILNGWFTNYDPSVDYFFINSNFIADKLGDWAENLRISTIAFNIGDLTFTYYPIYQVLYFIVYIILSLAMWFIYELAYDVICSWKDIAERNKAYKMDMLALEVSLNGREKGEPLNMEDTNKLILNNFTKRYGTSDVYAVKDANLTVNGGEVFGFLGPNGAGKSTIIKSIVGIQTITDGSISVCGYDVQTQPVEAKSQIGFVPDHYALYEKLTAREYVNYIADLYDVEQQVRDERLKEFIKLFEFENAIDNPIKTYSHGMKQKVTIMAALIHNPKVWILDEPLTGLDPNSIFQVKECMKNHAKQGNIVFFSSHIIDVVEKICDKIAIIRKGQIQCVKTIEEIEQITSLENFYMDIINNKDIQPIKVNEKQINNNKVTE